jgi:tRNA (cytidine/uridine-2'-O-)-methyltransferase
MLHVVLYQPEIPPNTGNIARQCVGMNAGLHIIGPINMDLSSSAVKRAGLDYWDQLDLTFHKQADDFLAWLGDRKPWLVSKHGILRFDYADYSDGDILIFGNEITGLPEQWLSRWISRAVYIPMSGNIRSYNLANTASIVLAHASLKSGMYDENF